MRQFLLRGCVWLAVANVALVGAPAGVGAAAPQTARAGREFKVRVRHAVTLEGGSLRLKFAGVASDSRCPVGVTCVWAGNAEVLVEVGAKGGAGKRTLRLNTDPSRRGAGEGRYGRYTVRLVGLSPQPREGRSIAAGEYTATLLVVRE